MLSLYLFLNNFCEWDPISFFCKRIASFPSTIFWRDYAFPTEYSWLPCQILVDHVCQDLFLGSRFCSIVLWVYFYADTITFFLELFIHLFIYSFIYGCVGSSPLREGPPQPRQAGATPHRGEQAPHCSGLSCCGAQAPDAQAQQLWLTGPVAPRHVGSSQTRARTRVPCIGRQTLNHCATREALP